jgi:hypothetical protein
VSTRSPHAVRALLRTPEIADLINASDVLGRTPLHAAAAIAALVSACLALPLTALVCAVGGARAASRRRRRDVEGSRRRHGVVTVAHAGWQRVGSGVGGKCERARAGDLTAWYRCAVGGVVGTVSVAGARALAGRAERRRDAALDAHTARARRAHHLAGGTGMRV